MKTGGGQLQRLQKLSDELRGFLMKTSRAFKLSQTGGDARFEAYSLILELTEEVPSFVVRFETEMSKLVVISEGLRQRWLREMQEVSKDAAFIPKGISKDHEKMGEWLGKITKPMRRILREIEPAIERARKETLRKEEEKKEALRQQANRPFSTQLQQALKRDFPDLLQELLAPPPEGEDDQRTRQWVDQEMSTLVNVIRDKSQILVDPKQNQILKISVLLVGSVPIPAKKALEAAGYKLSNPMKTYTGIANALVVAGPKPKTFVKNFKKEFPRSILKKKQMIVYPLEYVYRGRRFHLLVPKRAAVAGLELDEWGFTI